MHGRSAAVGRRVGLLGCAAVAVALLGGTAASATDEHDVRTRVMDGAPPGESGFFSVAGAAKGKLSGNPADFGAHVDDQRAAYWSFQPKPGSFSSPTGPAEHPGPGVSIHRDGYGVPVVVGDNVRDLWYGVGYAEAEDRLFEMDAIRRTAEGTLAELTGPDQVPADVAARIRGYGADEYAAIFAQAPPDIRAAALGYVDGVNRRIAEVLLNPALLPYQYALLTSVPAAWTLDDTLASGVLIARTVASAGGDEWANVDFLRRLEAAYGRQRGRAVFQDVAWLYDDNTVTTVPRSSGVFSNNPTPPAQREAAFQAAADYADALPEDLRYGPGDPSPGAKGPPLVPHGPVTAEQARAEAAHAIDAWAASLHGGSYTYALSPSRTRDHHTLLESAPQLGYTYPSELYELEVHGAGFDARGVGVPGIPVVGIGYGKRIAWGVTTGDSKTIDSFIEHTRRNPAGGDPQFLHDGVWLDEQCRNEVVRYRQAVNGVPVGPPVQSQAVRVCRTVHGPIVATHSGGALARSVQYAMFRGELGTLVGILGWDRDQSLASFRADVAGVTWNANIMYADADGHIAYFHTGRFPRRAVGVDPRFPADGAGAQDWQGFLSFDEMPHAVDPPQGFLANWNNIPARGWDNGSSNIPPERPEGSSYRVEDILDLLATRSDWGAADLVAIDRHTGTTDGRAKPFKPLLAAIRATAVGRSARALDLVLAWDGSYFGPGAQSSPDGLTDGPAPTIFDAFVAALERDVLGGIPHEDPAQPGNDRLTCCAGDEPSVADSLLIRILEPGASALTPSHDYLNGLPARAVIGAALDHGLAALAAQYGTADLGAYRRLHPREQIDALEGCATGPCSTMPFEDRGTWMQLVDITTDAALAEQPGPARSPLPGTGPSAPDAAAAAAAVALGVAAALAARRRRARPASTTARGACRGGDITPWRRRHSS